MDDQEIISRLHADLGDSYDEERELELDDRRIGAGSPGDLERDARAFYF